MKRSKYLSTFIMTILILSLTCASSFASEFTNNTPNIIGESAIVMDMDTGEIILSKNAEAQRPVASTIKLLTSLIYAENISKTASIPFTEDALKTTITSLNNLKKINAGDVISSDDLMKAVMISSANDAAYLMADSVAGNYKDFVAMMNDRVKSLGLKNTKIVNPCGLESNAIDPQSKEINVSTAYDIAVIAKEAYKNDWIRDTISNQSDNISIEIDGERVSIPVRNKIIGQYGNVGGKTGNEIKAGHCFVGFFQRGGRNLLTVVLSSEYGSDGTNVFNDTIEIANQGYESKKVVYRKANEEICKIKLQYRKFGFIGPKKSIEVPVIATQDILYYKNDINEQNINIEYKGENNRALSMANKEIQLNYSLPNYKTTISGKVNISKLELIKKNVVAFILSIIQVIAILFVIAYIIRLNNLRKKRNRRSNKKTIKKRKK